MCVVLAALPARASSFEAFVSSPLVIGVDQHVGADHATEFAIGWRPEIIAAYRPRSDRAYGLGGYGEIEHAGADWAGGGLTAAYYFGSWGAAVSGGLDQRSLDGTHQLTSVYGGFFGLRQSNLTGTELSFDMPIGLRFDVRPGFSQVPTSLAFQVQLDVPGIVAFFILLALHPDYNH